MLHESKPVLDASDITRGSNPFSATKRECLEIGTPFVYQGLVEFLIGFYRSK